MTREEAIEAFRNLLNDIDKDNHLFVGTINPELLNMAIEALKAQLSTESTTKGTTFEWIPVSEKLPNYNVAVLVTEENGRVCVAYLDDVLMGEWYDGDLNAIEPIAWMKMPEPYKGEQDASRIDRC